ncbi:hypothetical protein N665_0157s0007 [Sinapis alba]|nr:hypothetical protein N665_0157s0007 [Sinapis alba]
MGKLIRFAGSWVVASLPGSLCLALFFLYNYMI